MVRNCIDTTVMCNTHATEGTVLGFGHKWTFLLSAHSYLTFHIYSCLLDKK